MEVITPQLWIAMNSEIFFILFTDPHDSGPLPMIIDTANWESCVQNGVDIISQIFQVQRPLV